MLIALQERQKVPKGFLKPHGVRIFCVSSLSLVVSFGRVSYCCVAVYCGGGCFFVRCLKFPQVVFFMLLSCCSLCAWNTQTLHRFMVLGHACRDVGSTMAKVQSFFGSLSGKPRKEVGRGDVLPGGFSACGCEDFSVSDHGPSVLMFPPSPPEHSQTSLSGRY